MASAVVKNGSNQSKDEERNQDRKNGDYESGEETDIPSVCVAKGKKTR